MFLLKDQLSIKYEVVLFVEYSILPAQVHCGYFVPSRVHHLDTNTKQCIVGFHEHTGYSPGHNWRKKNISYIVKGVVSDEHTITHEYFMCGISHMTKAIHKTDRAAIMDINHTY